MSNYLTDRRKELGLTMKQVAELVGVSEATVSRWESGQIANMKRDKINSYAKALHVTPSFIMTGEKEQPIIPQGFQPIPNMKKNSPYRTDCLRHSYPCGGKCGRIR